MRMLLPLTLSLAIAACVAAEPPIHQADPKDEMALFFFDSTRPVRLLLHLQVGGRSFKANWDEVMAQLFHFLDYDRNGVLSAREVEHAPSVAQLRQLIQGNTELEADEPPKMSDLTDRPDAGVTLQQLKGYYHRVGVAPWQVDWVARVSNADNLDDELIKRLSPKSPERLSLASLKDAPHLLRQLDTDNDEMITVSELSPAGYSGHFQNAKPFSSTKQGPFFLLDDSDKGRSLLAAAIIQQYDRDKDGKLSAKEIAFDAATFARLDRNHDGLLDAAELAAWCQGEPDLEVLQRLDGPPSEGTVLMKGTAGQQRHLAAIAKTTRIGAILLPFTDNQVEILRVDGAFTRMQRTEQLGLDLFTTLDRNKDDVLDSQEIFQPPFGLVAVLRLADRNSDGKLSKQEYREYLDLQKKMVTRYVVLTLVERGRSFFDFLDADHDHRLGLRELASAAARLSPWMDATKQEIEVGKIPQQFQIIVSQGKLPLLDSDPGAASAFRPETRLRGPLWFRKMDRNADGDVSLAEFLGTAEQFRRIDRDGDGLIDREEAEAAGDPARRLSGAKPKP